MPIAASQIGPLTEPLQTTGRQPLPGVANMANKGYADGLLSRTIEKKYTISQALVDEQRTRFYAPEPFESATLEVFRDGYFEPCLEVGHNAFDIFVASDVGQLFEILYVPFIGACGNKPYLTATGILTTTVTLTVEEVRNSLFNIAPSSGYVSITLPTMTADEDGSFVSFNLESPISARIYPGVGATIDSYPSYVSLSEVGDSLPLVYVHAQARWVIVGRSGF